MPATQTPTPDTRKPQPWYTHPWPWLLMAAPVAAVLWGSTGLYLAIRYRDPLVTEHAWQDGQALQRGMQPPVVPAGRSPGTPAAPVAPGPSGSR